MLHVDTQGAETRTMDTGRRHSMGIGDAHSSGSHMGIYRVMTICCTVNKSAVFIVQSPAFGSYNPDSRWF